MIVLAKYDRIEPICLQQNVVTHILYIYTLYITLAGHFDL
jgi:hypothetical protein